MMKKFVNLRAPFQFLQKHLAPKRTLVKFAKLSGFACLSFALLANCKSRDSIPSEYLPRTDTMVVLKDKEGIQMLSKFLEDNTDANKKYSGYLELLSKETDIDSVVFGFNAGIATFDYDYLMASGRGIFQKLVKYYPNIEQYQKEGKIGSSSLEFFKIMPGSYWITSINKREKKLGDDVLVVALNDTAKNHIKQNVQDKGDAHETSDLLHRVISSDDYHIALYTKIPKGLSNFMFNLSDFEEIAFKVTTSDTKYTSISFEGKLAQGVKHEEAQNRFRLVLGLLFNIFGEINPAFDAKFAKNLFPVMVAGDSITISGVFTPALTDSIVSIFKDTSTKIKSNPQALQGNLTTIQKSN